MWFIVRKIGNAFTRLAMWLDPSERWEHTTPNRFATRLWEMGGTLEAYADSKLPESKQIYVHPY